VEGRSASRPSRIPRLTGALALGVAVAVSQLLYARGWDNALVSDDWFFLYSASKIQRPAQLLQFFSFDVEAFVRPTQWLVTTTLYRLFGITPAGYHVASQALDLGNALLFGFLVWQLQALAAGVGARPSRLAAGLAAILFLFSWRHHEAVFWFSAINELLAGAFRLLTLNLAAWSLRTGRGGGPLWLAVLASSALTMLSKESAVTLPVEVLLLVTLARLAGPDPATSWRHGLRLVSAPALVILAWAWLFIRTSTHVLIPRALARGVSQTLTATPGEWALRLLQFVNANYAGTEAVSANVSALALELVILLALSSVAVVRRRYLWLFALAWTVVAAAPYALVSHGPDLGLTPVLTLGVRGDRFLYASAMGASLLAVASGRWLLDELAGSRWLPVARGVAVAGAAGILLVHGSRLRTAEADWDIAGRIVTRVTAQLRTEWLQPSPGTTLCLARLPHTYEGKPVYRNGVAESVFLTYDRDDFAVIRLERLTEPAARSRCAATFVWVGLDRGLVKARLVEGGTSEARP
jgi:hypothetical protein